MSERIIIAGVGPAGASEMTRGTRQAFLSADIIIGAGRILEGLRDEAEETEKIYVKEYRAGRIAEYIVNDSERYPQRLYFICLLYTSFILESSFLNWLKAVFFIPPLPGR